MRLPAHQPLITSAPLIRNCERDTETSSARTSTKRCNVDGSLYEFALIETQVDVADVPLGGTTSLGAIIRLHRH